jgi:hypothetical protein
MLTRVGTLPSAAFRKRLSGSNLRLLAHSVHVPKNGTKGVRHIATLAIQTKGESMHKMMMAVALILSWAAVAQAGGFETVPEPTSLALLSVGAIGVAWWARRRR